MQLNAYIKKRNFKKTPEPSVSVRRKRSALHFVVQEHHASHLHYDFRLEMEGVLKSWAIPKGPSMDPKDKRLAIMMEDHPYSYKDFEGTIPKGNYGAGTVKIWDNGTYEPALINSENSTKHLLAGLKKGHLSFILHGKKLTGEFALIKLSATRSKNENAWLLIKKMDDYAISGKKKLLKKTQSLNAAENMLSKAPKIPMLKSVYPMLAKLIPTAFNSPEWAFEIKWDGFRIVAYTNNTSVKLISRNQKDYTKVFQLVADELAALHIKAIFDGEMVVLDSHLRSSFQHLQQYQKTGIGHLVYYVFDLLWFNGHDLRQLSFQERRSLLKMVLQNTAHVRISEEVIGKGKAFFNLASKKNLEGIMAKRISSMYQDDHRSADWLKIKTHLQQEAIICGYTAPRGSRKYLGALILGVYENKILTYIGHTGTGFDAATLATLKKQLDRFKVKTCPFRSEPKTNAQATWLKPHWVAEIQFSEWTEEGIMRQPVFMGLRDDKTPKEVRHERFEKNIR